MAAPGKTRMNIGDVILGAHREREKKGTLGMRWYDIMAKKEDRNEDIVRGISMVTRRRGTPWTSLSLAVSYSVLWQNR